MTVTTRPFPLTRIRHASNFPKYGRRYIVNAQNHEHGYDRIPLSRQTDCKKLIGPSLQYSNLESLEVQLSALKNNNEPYLDHGIEVLYRFAGIDPWSRSNYFGRSLDLGQFERFRRIMNTECFSLLVNHSSYEVLSSLELSESDWKARVKIINSFRKRESVFEFTLCRRFGGRYDGVWFCDQIIADEDFEGRHLYGVI